MGLDVYFKDDVASAIVSSIGLVIDTLIEEREIPDKLFVRGVMAMARAQARVFKIPWATIVEMLGEEGIWAQALPS